MDRYENIAEGVYLIGGPNISHAADATVFVVDFSGELILIDSGAGRSVRTLIQNMERASLDPSKLTYVILTHCHIDHIGGAPFFRNQFGCRLIIHCEDAGAMADGDPVRTASGWYGVKFPPTRADLELEGDEGKLRFGPGEIHFLHTPGHTPGSIAVYLDRNGERILFGQDIHGPFLPGFGSDIMAWRRSMQKLMALEADILCEGHFGIFRSKARVNRYIQKYLDDNPNP